MPQTILQKYDYSRMQYAIPPVVYKSFKPGPLLLADSMTLFSWIGIDNDNQYRYLEGGLGGATLGATKVTSMFPTVTSPDIYVSETRWLRGSYNSNTGEVRMSLKADQSNGPVAELQGLDMSPGGEYQLTDSIYWYVDEVYGTNFSPPVSGTFLRFMTLVVHATPVDGYYAHVRGTYAFFTNDTKSWMKGVRDQMHLPDDPTDPGDGEYDGSSDEIPIPGFPAVDAVSSGLVRAYKCDAAQINALATELWNPTFIQTIESYFTSPDESLINVGILPFTPSIGNTNVNMKLGNYTCSTAQGKVVTSQWYTVNCGTVNLTEYYGSYLDYQSHVSIYLPYIGSRDMNPEDVMGASLHLEYHIDVLTGSVNAMIKVTKNTPRGHNLKSVIYTFNGTCMSSIPLSATNAAQKMAGLVGAVGSVVAGAATAAATGGAGAAIGAGIIASGLSSATQSQQTHYSRCGGLTADSALIGVQQPYITVMRPRFGLPSAYYDVRGGQVYISGINNVKKLSALRGMTVCEKILVAGLNATEEERNEIQQLAREGIIL